MSTGEELIWVDKEFAKKFNEMKTKKAERDSQIEVLDEYLKTVTESSKRDFRASLESLEEDSAIYSGLMLKVKQTFGKVSDTALDESYKLWEEYEKQKPSIEKKTKEITDSLDPFLKKLEEINGKLEKINVYKFERVLEIVGKFNGMSDDSKKVMQFLLENFGEK